MYLTQEHDLKFHKMRAIFSLLPPIQRLELVIRRLLIAGFTLLTAGLLIGAVWLKLPAGVSYLDDPKVHWSILVWLLYLGLLVMRQWFAQSGRRFAWGAVSRHRTNPSRSGTCSASASTAAITSAWL